jgi:hypothetical protein
MPLSKPAAVLAARASAADLPEGRLSVFPHPPPVYAESPYRDGTRERGTAARPSHGRRPEVAQHERDDLGRGRVVALHHRPSISH